MSDRVQELAEIWREVISTDHHKRRDGYFSITKSWDYERGPAYCAEHAAYIGEELLGEYRDTYEEAERDLVEHILKLTRGLYAWATRVIESKDPDELAWNGDTARHTLEVINRNLEILKGTE